MPTDEITRIAASQQGFLIASLVCNCALAMVVAFIYRSREKLVDKFIDYIIKQNEFLNYEKKD